MLEDDDCAQGYHVAPETGGCCPCGMVTRVPAIRQRERDTAVRDLVARCLVEPGGVPDLADLRRRADRVLGALAAAGLAVGPPQVAGAAVVQRSA